MRLQWVRTGLVLVALVGAIVAGAGAEEMVSPAAAEKGVRGLANAGLGVVVELP